MTNPLLAMPLLLVHDETIEERHGMADSELLELTTQSAENNPHTVSEPTCPQILLPVQDLPLTIGEDPVSKLLSENAPTPCVPCCIIGLVPCSGETIASSPFHSTGWKGHLVTSPSGVRNLRLLLTLWALFFLSLYGTILGFGPPQLLGRLSRPIAEIIGVSCFLTMVFAICYLAVGSSSYLVQQVKTKHWIIEDARIFNAWRWSGSAIAVAAFIAILFGAGLASSWYVKGIFLERLVSSVDTHALIEAIHFFNNATGNNVSFPMVVLQESITSIRQLSNLIATLFFLLFLGTVLSVLSLKTCIVRCVTYFWWAVITLTPIGLLTVAVVFLDVERNTSDVPSYKDAVRIFNISNDIVKLYVTNASIAKLNLSIQEYIVLPQRLKQKHPVWWTAGDVTLRSTSEMFLWLMAVTGYLTVILQLATVMKFCLRHHRPSETNIFYLCALLRGAFIPNICWPPDFEDDALGHSIS